MAEVLSMKTLERERLYAFCRMLVQSLLAESSLKACDSEAADRHAMLAAQFAEQLEAAEQRIAIALSAVE
jgi:hypothetical protein